MSQFSELFPTESDDELPYGLGWRWDWFVDQKTIEAYISEIHATDSLPVAEFYSQQVAEADYHNATAEWALKIATANAAMNEDDEAEAAAVAEKAGKKFEDFQADVAALARVMMKRIELRSKINQVLNQGTKQ